MRCKCHAETGRLSVAAFLSLHTKDGVVCPAILQKGLFTTSAVDNIDHNPSPTTATISCHGTGISVFQHPVSSTFSDSPLPFDE
jgi:hypothetical protein